MSAHRAISATYTLILSFFLSIALGGCGGGGAKTFYYHRNTTTGQELSDLQSALQRGAISEQEYKEQREKILKGDQN